VGGGENVPIFVANCRLGLITRAVAVFMHLSLHSALQ
jgi:hypothetical protein